MRKTEVLQCTGAAGYSVNVYEQANLECACLYRSFILQWLWSYLKIWGNVLHLGMKCWYNMIHSTITKIFKKSSQNTTVSFKYTKLSDALDCQFT